jgi:hypothetical protein
MVFVAGGKVVKVQLGEKEVDLPESGRNNALVQGLKITKEDALQLIRELSEIAPAQAPQKLPQLLLSFAQRGPTNPQKYLQRMLDDPAGGMGLDAVTRPVSKNTRDRLKDIGIDEHGQQLQSLSHLAIVFKESYAGQFTQEKSSSGEFTEWQYIDPRSGERANTFVFHLGIVHVGDEGIYDGVIIDVISHNPNMKGGRATLIKLMKKAGWKLKPGLS